MKRVEMIEEYLHDENGGDYIWHDNHGILVRCKDCKAVGIGKDGATQYYVCMARGEAVDPNDFCSKGERKDG